MVYGLARAKLREDHMEELLIELRSYIPLPNSTDDVGVLRKADAEAISRLTKVELLDLLQDMRAILEDAGIRLNETGKPIMIPPSD